MSTLTLPIKLTHSEAQGCLAQLLETLSQSSEPTSGPVHLSAKALHQFDSSALAVLLELKRKLMDMGRDLVIEEPTQALLSLVQVYGVADFLMGSASH